MWFKVQRRSHVALVIIIALLLTIQTSFCDEKSLTEKSRDAGDVKPPGKPTTNPEIVDKKSKNETTTISPSKPKALDGGKGKINGTDNVMKTSNVQSKNQTTNHVESTELPVLHTPTLNPGAFKRAFYVFVGLSVIVVAYLMVRSSRLHKSPAQMVRKYGVLAHKQDLEMRPLPLDEDDEDETTVFDASGLSLNSQQTAKA